MIWACRGRPIATALPEWRRGQAHAAHASQHRAEIAVKMLSNYSNHSSTRRSTRWSPRASGRDRPEPLAVARTPPGIVNNTCGTVRGVVTDRRIHFHCGRRPLPDARDAGLPGQPHRAIPRGLLVSQGAGSGLAVARTQRRGSTRDVMLPEGLAQGRNLSGLVEVRFEHGEDGVRRLLTPGAVEGGVSVERSRASPPARSGDL